MAKRTDALLRGIFKLYSYSVIFTSLDGVIQRSIRLINELNIEEKVCLLDLPPATIDHSHSRVLRYIGYFPAIVKLRGVPVL